MTHEPAPPSHSPESDPVVVDSGAASPTLAALSHTGLLGLAWVVVPALGGFYLLARIGPVSEWLQSHGSAGVLIYAALFMITAGLGLLPTYAQAILGGWVFGLAVGLPAALVGFTGAALIGYAVTRLITRDGVERYIMARPKLLAARNALVGRGFWGALGIVTLWRVPPNSPFAVSNWAFANVQVALAPYALGTFLGMLPRTAVTIGFASAAAGTGARDIQEFAREGPGTWILLIGIALMVIVLGVISTIANRAIERVLDNQGAAEPPAHA